MVQNDFVTFSGIVSAIRSYYKIVKLVHREIEQDSGTIIKRQVNACLGLNHIKDNS